MKIYYKLNLLFISLLFILTLLTAVSVNFMMSETLENEMLDKELTIIEYVTEDLANPLLRDDIMRVQEIIDSTLIRNEDIRYIYVVDFHGFVVAHTFPQGFPVDLVAVNPVPLKENNAFQIVSVNGESIQDIGVRVLEGMDAKVYFGFSRAHYLDSVNTTTNLIFGISAVILLLSMAMSILLTNSITRPIEMLVKGTKKVAEGDLDYKIDVAGTDEMGVLTDSFNRMTSERKLAEQEILAKNRDLSALYSITTIASKSTELDDILSNILSEMIDFLEIAAGGIYLIDEDAGEMVLRIHQGLPDEFVEKVRCVSLDKPYIAALLTSKKSVISQEFTSLGEKTVKSFEDYGIRKLLTIQLRSREKVIGFVNMSVPAEHEISEEDIHVLESVGNQVGIAIENVRLFEETKKAYDELKSLDKMKDEFLSNISHELKTPLVSITGYSGLLYDEELGALNEGQKKAMDAVVRNSERLKHLIESLVYLTLVNAGKFQYRFDHVQIAKIIDNAVMDMIPQVEKKGLTIEQDMPDGLPIISGDTDRLTQILVNLIGNAIKFTHTGGRITVAAFEEDHDLHITMSDTGIGIPQDLISKLFQRFYQVDASATRRYGGTGLGLYISKLIVEAHSGKIWVESEEGVGTTIHLLLPKVK